MNIELSREQAILLRALSDANVKDIRNGSVTIHFDHEGNVRLIEVMTQTRYPQLANLTRHGV